jgi:ribosomal protein S18 acetylase RimI-like enzyme
MSISADAGLRELTEGLVLLQEDLLTRDPWLPRGADAVREQLGHASEEGALIVISRAVGALGLLRSDYGLLRLLGPVATGEAEWREAGEILISELERSQAVRGERVKAAANAENRRRWQLLESAGFRRYNAELTLSMAREEWSPASGRYTYRGPRGGGERRGRRRGATPTVRPRRSVRIRPYRSGDAGALRTLHPETAYFSADTVVAKSETGEGMTFIAEEELGDRSRPVGYLYQEVEDGSGEICFVNVAESARGEGLGTRLLTTALDHLFYLEGANSVEISVRPDNPAADLYRRLGFSPVVTYYSYERRF